MQNMTNRQTIKNLETEKAYYEQETEKNTRRLQELKSDKHDLEKFARERYFMKKADEDVFVISPEVVPCGTTSQSNVLAVGVGSPLPA